MECNITIQYKKIKLADNFFIFRPVKAVTGTLFEEDETEYLYIRRWGCFIRN